MATATDPSAQQAPDLPLAAVALGLYPSIAAALDAGHRLAARSGGGVPLVTQLGDGTAWLRGIVQDGPPAAPATTQNSFILDERGKHIPSTAEERAARVKAMDEFIARREAEVWDDDQVHRARQVCKTLGVPGYEDVEMDDDTLPAGES